MPTIPTYQRQVNPQGLPNARISQAVTPETMGAGAFKGLGTLAAGMREYQDKQDTADVISAKNELQSRTTDLLYNKDNGLMFREGSQAKGTIDTFNSTFDKHTTEIRSQLSDRQKAAFDSYVANYKNGMQTHVTTHEVKQTEVALANSFKNLTYNTSHTLNQPGVYQNPELVNTMLSDWEKGARATNPKEDAETLNRIITKGKDELLKTSLDTLYKQNDADGVKAFLKLYGDKMSIDSAAPYQGWIEKKEERFKSQQLADGLFAKHGIDNERAAMQELKEQYGNTPLFEKAASFLQSKYVDERRFKKEDTEKYENDIVTMVMSADSQATAESIVNDSNLPPKTKLWLQNSYIKPKFKVLAGKPTAEQKWVSKYESNPEGMAKDLEIMREYYQRTTGQDDAEISAKDQTRYNMATIRLKRYQSFHGAGGYSLQEPSNMGEFKEDEDTNSDEASNDPIGKWIDKARNAGASPEWVKDKLKAKGYDDYDSWVW